VAVVSTAAFGASATLTFGFVPSSSPSAGQIAGLHEPDTEAHLLEPQHALVLHARKHLYDLGSSVCRGRPPKDKEMAAAERAPKRQKKPVESCLKGIPVFHTSKIDRSAMWTTGEEHTLQHRDSPGSTGYFS
jgi:hypothetical protein